MIILDTDVLSELLRGPQADRRVLTWMRGLRETPVTTVITCSELLAGVAVLADGRRRGQLLSGVERALGVLGDCLPLRAAQAATYAEMIAARRTQGRPLWRRAMWPGSTVLV
jgi:toxin FitB